MKAKHYAEMDRGSCELSISIQKDHCSLFFGPRLVATFIRSTKDGKGHAYSFFSHEDEVREYVATLPYYPPTRVFPMAIPRDLGLVIDELLGLEEEPYRAPTNALGYMLEGYGLPPFPGLFHGFDLA